MRKVQKGKATGILGDVFKPRGMTAQDMQILERAEMIRAQHSSMGRAREALQEIRHYVVESKHSIPQKIKNLKADLAKTQDPTVRKALEKAIEELQNF